MKIKDIVEDYDDEYEEDEESIKEDAIQEIVYNIKRFCQPYMKMNPDFIDNPLFRGKDLDGEYWIDESSPTNRVPVDMPRNMSAIIDSGMKAAGLKATRTNSLFCTGAYRQADQYGDLCVVFPQGDFNYTYSDVFTDLYTQREDVFFKIIYPAIIDKTEFDKEIISDMFYRRRHGEIDSMLKPNNIDKSVIVNMIKEYFTNTGISDAIYTGHEILISNDCILVDKDFFDEYIASELR